MEGAGVAALAVDAGTSLRAPRSFGRLHSALWRFVSYTKRSILPELRTRAICNAALGHLNCHALVAHHETGALAVVDRVTQLCGIDSDDAGRDTDDESLSGRRGDTEVPAQELAGLIRFLGGLAFTRRRRCCSTRRRLGAVSAHMELHLAEELVRLLHGDGSAGLHALDLMPSIISGCAVSPAHRRLVGPDGWDIFASDVQLSTSVRKSCFDHSGWTER